MQSITATDVVAETANPIGDNLALLGANVGKRVKLVFVGVRPSVTGKVISASAKMTLLDEGASTGSYSTENIDSIKILEPAKTSTAIHYKKRILRIVVSGN